MSSTQKIGPVDVFHHQYPSQNLYRSRDRDKMKYADCGSGCSRCVDDNAGHSFMPLWKAAADGDLESVQSFIEEKSTTYSRRYPGFPSDNIDHALVCAASSGHLEVVKFLVSIGINVAVECSAAVWQAASAGHLEVVKYLVSLGADVTEWDDSALRSSVRHNHIETVRYLISAGANVTSTHNESVINSAWYGKLEMVELLISAGANSELAISNAISNKQWKLVRHLISIGINYRTSWLDRLFGSVLGIESSEIPDSPEMMLVALDIFLTNRE